MYMGICCVLMWSFAYFLMSRLHSGRDPGSFVYDNKFAMEPKYHVFASFASDTFMM